MRASQLARQSRKRRQDYIQWLKRDDELHGQIRGCIAYLADGRICGAPASVLDLARGGMVCDMHAPQCGVLEVKP